MSNHSASFLALGSALMLGCTMNQAAGDGGTSSSDTINCVPDSGDWPIDTYSANLTKPGRNGVLTFVLVKSDPAPPVQANNTFTVKITHNDGTPFTGMLTAPNYSNLGIWMPRHNHGTTIEDAITLIDPSQGIFKIDPVNLFMQGYWQIRLNAYETTQPADGGAPIVPQAPTDVGVFHFCIGY